MGVSFNGVGELAMTFCTEGTVQKMQPVKICANGTISACNAGERFCGVAAHVSEDGFALVQTCGYVCLPYSGTAPALGYYNFAADGNGGVTAGEDGEVLVVEVDEANRTVGFIM